MPVGDGTPGPGRPKGSQNKATASIKAAFKEAFEELGGAPALAKWGRENPTDFYRLAARLIPTEIQGGVSVVNKHAEELTREELLAIAAGGRADVRG